MVATTVQLPTRFEKIDQLDGDSRFQKVKIYIAHTGENLNNSVFSQATLLKMTPSLAYVPILGYIAETEDTEDFGGHEKHLQIKDNEFLVRFKTNAYGFIPDDNNAHFEVTGGKEWLVAEGYLWTRFVDAMEIFDRANGSKSQSMEIGDASYHVDDVGRVVYQDGKFQGLCILGDNVPPAMTGSTISTVFSQTDVKSAMKEMLAEFSAEKGDDSVAVKKKQDDEETKVPETPKAPKVETKAPSEAAPKVVTSNPEPTPSKVTVEEEPKVTQPTEAHVDVDPAPVGETTHTPEAQPTAGAHDDHPEESHDDHESAGSSSEMSATDNKDKDSQSDDDESVDEAGNDDSSDDKKQKDQFALRDTVRSAISNEYSGNGQVAVWMVELFEDHAVVAFENSEDRHLYDIQYSVDKDKQVALGEKVEVVSSYKTLSEAEKDKKNRHKMCELEAQVASLSEYKNGIEMQAKQEALDEAAGQLTSSQFEAIKENFATMSVEDVEKEIAFAVYTTHKAEFSGNSNAGVKASNMTNKKENYGYGSANELFHN